MDANGASVPVFDISDDGQFVTFLSGATNLGSSDSNGRGDLFTFDRATRSTSFTCPSLPSQFVEDLTHDRRFVTLGTAEALLPSDTNGVLDVYVHDCQTGATELSSSKSSGAQATAASFQSDITPDGRFVAFLSAAPLVPADTNGRLDAYVFDRMTHTTERVSVGNAGEQVDKDVVRPTISDDGRFVSFHTSSATLIPGDTDSRNDVFVYDRTNHTIEEVSVNSAAVPSNGQSTDARISADGRYVAFWSLAKNLGASDGNIHVYVRDRTAGTTELLVVPTGSNATFGGTVPVFSPDARFVAVATDSGSTNPGPGAYLVDRRHARRRAHQRGQSRRGGQCAHVEDRPQP